MTGEPEQPRQPEPVWVKAPELADLAGCSEQTIRNWARDGVIPAACVRKGRPVLYDRDAAAAAIRANRAGHSHGGNRGGGRPTKGERDPAAAMTPMTPATAGSEDTPAGTAGAEKAASQRVTIGDVLPMTREELQSIVAAPVAITGLQKNDVDRLNGLLTAAAKALEVRKAAGELVDVREADDALQRQLAAARRHIEAIPAQASAELADSVWPSGLADDVRAELLESGVTPEDADRMTQSLRRPRELGVMIRARLAEATDAALAAIVAEAAEIAVGHADARSDDDDDDDDVDQADAIDATGD